MNLKHLQSNQWLIMNTLFQLTYCQSNNASGRRNGLSKIKQDYQLSCNLSPPCSLTAANESLCL